jgi:hypothetical protein
VSQRSVSPSKFESQATNSPSKLSVPNRKQRNQPSNRVHDIEFATEISTSLLSQVRNLQALLAEKEEALKLVTNEKSRLELQAEGFSQRLRTLDESEQRYKDENWNLETQVHEHLATAKEAADREKKLAQNLIILQADKSSAQKELDEIKLSHAKLLDDHTAALKHHDVELGSAKRTMTMADNERGALQRKIEELTGQNQELAKAVALQRGRLEDREQARGLSDEDFETAPDNNTPEHSPPPSPIKGTPRHSMLESETLKSSLHHAHRMIQNLKGNIHREKTEKLELKRMLQDARDELETRRSEGGLGSANGKKGRKVDSKEFKKPPKPGQLGGLRSSRSEVFIDDTNWEEDDAQRSPTHSAAIIAARVAAGASAVESSDNFETANEASDDFETANERGTETEDFQTGVEDMSGSDELTETETAAEGTIKKRSTAISLTQRGNRNSFQSTASASGDDYSYEDLKTPTSHQPQRLRLKVNRASNRLSRAVSEEPSFQSSPAGFANGSENGTPQPAGQSLFAELGDLGGSDEDESLQGTPSRSTFASGAATPSPRPSTTKGTPAHVYSLPPVPKLPMIDSAMMTEPWEPKPTTPQTALPEIVGASLASAGLLEATQSMSKPSTDVKAPVSDAASQWYDDQFNNNLMVAANPQGSRPISTSTYSDTGSQYEPVITDEKLASFPSPPRSPAHTPMASVGRLEAVPLSMSTIVSEQVEPIEPESPTLPDQPKVFQPSTPKAKSVPDPLAFSSIQSVDTEPLLPILPPSPRREAVILPRDEEPAIRSEDQHAPKDTFIGSIFGWKNTKASEAPIIAEDETSQPLHELPILGSFESPGPFQELSHNTNERTIKRPKVETTDESSQTALTSDEIDTMLKNKRQETVVENGSKYAPHLLPQSGSILSVVRVRRSQESIGSVSRSRSKMVDPDFGHDTALLKRPSSAGSGRANSISSIHPPLPTDHKQVIAAAAQRSGSSSGGPGSMGPPPIPVATLRTSTNPSFRPRTPSTQAPLSPGSLKGGTTPRPLHASGRTDVISPSGTGRSRRSSVSSFASEIESRFNIRNGMLPQGIEPGTDPRMINAITQTMIGEYLWKYTRKAGREAMSEKRHRRYFWVHPYTKTLYWSDRDPSLAGRAELKAKSVPIEAVRVVTDDNPMPPGLHRKSLVIVTAGRSVKFTATTGQRHETWFNALSYLLLRTGDETNNDTSEIANGALTREDVDEFNPGYSSSIRRGPASLSSYNSRTTHNESPGRKATRMSLPVQPQLSSTSSRPMGTLSRLSNYWKPGDSKVGESPGRGSRQSMRGTGSIYEASEVHDSAEDLREMIEKQDRESDRLENVRACCDGKFGSIGDLRAILKFGLANTNRQTRCWPSTPQFPKGTAFSRTSGGIGVSVPASATEEEPGSEQRKQTHRLVIPHSPRATGFPF